MRLCFDRPLRTELLMWMGDLSCHLVRNLIYSRWCAMCQLATHTPDCRDEFRSATKKSVGVASQYRRAQVTPMALFGRAGWLACSSSS